MTTRYGSSALRRQDLICQMTGYNGGARERDRTAIRAGHNNSVRYTARQTGGFPVFHCERSRAAGELCINRYR